MKVKKIDVKEDSRLFFCSDIHGEIDFLLGSLKTLGFVVGNDVLVCAGDLIDRGSDSFKTARFFCNDKTGSFHSVIGNHDLFAIELDFDNWFFNGGRWILDDLSTFEEQVCFSEMMKQLPLAIDVTKGDHCIGVTHACVPYEFESWSDFTGIIKTRCTKDLVFEIVWQREFIEYSDNKFYKDAFVLGVDFTVHGHTPIKEPMFVANRLHIDTGLVYGKHLTIAEFKNGAFEFHKFKKEN